MLLLAALFDRGVHILGFVEVGKLVGEIREF